MSEDAQKFKSEGTEAFKGKEFEKAIECFKKAIEASPSDHTLYGNTSAAYYNLEEFDEALKFADECIKVKPDWSKGYQRKGNALAKLNKKEEAREVFATGLELEPTNEQIKTALQNLDKPAEEGFFTAEVMAKLKVDPKTSAWFEEPDF
jgi:stress-induced-phosphoprotein 1